MKEGKEGDSTRGTTAEQLDLTSARHDNLARRLPAMLAATSHEISDKPPSPATTASQQMGSAGFDMGFASASFARESRHRCV